MNVPNELIYFDAEVVTSEWGTLVMTDNNISYSLEGPKVFLNVATDLYGLWRL
jgi:hypothetical protein